MSVINRFAKTILEADISNVIKISHLYSTFKVIFITATTICS